MPATMITRRSQKRYGTDCPFSVLGRGLTKVFLKELQKVMDRTAAETHLETQQWVDKKNTERAARGARPITLPASPGGSAEVAQGEPDPTEENLRILVKRVQAEGWKTFGFWAFRTHFSNETLWESFEAAFMELLDEGIAAAPADSGIAQLDDNVMVRFVSDEIIANQGPEGVSYAYELCLDDADSDDDEQDDDAGDWPDEPEPGMRTRMCLMVDEEVMRSVIDRKPGSTPFIKAVDASLHQQGSQPLPYAGTFKVAISSLITKFYAALLVYDVADVASAVRDGVWTDTGPFDREREGRKLQKLTASY